MNYAYFLSSASDLFAETVLWLLSLALPALGWWTFRKPDSVEVSRSEQLGTAGESGHARSS